MFCSKLKKHIGVVGNPELPTIVTNNEDIGIIDPPVDPTVRQVNIKKEV